MVGNLEKSFHAGSPSLVAGNATTATVWRSPSKTHGALLRLWVIGSASTNVDAVNHWNARRTESTEQLFSSRTLSVHVEEHTVVPEGRQQR
jgi:hypothetical protein